MLERKATYSPKNKIAWLIERTTRIVGQNFSHQAGNHCYTPEEVRQAIMRYLLDEQLKSEQKALIQPLLPYLDGLKGYQTTIAEIQQQLDGGNPQDAAGKLASNIRYLRSELQIGLIALDATRSAQLLEAYAAVTAQYAFLAGISHINNENLETAIQYFSDAGYDSLIAGYDDNALRFSYLTVLLLMANKQYPEVVYRYDHAQRLALAINDNIIGYKAKVGWAVALFLSGEKTKANQSLKDILSEVRKDHFLAATIFNEFGDQLYGLGLIDIAFYIYQEGFQYAISTERLSEVYDALSDLIRCYFNLGKPIDPLLSLIQKAIALAKKLGQDTRQQHFEILYSRVKHMLEPAETDFPILNQDVKLNQIDSRLADWLPIIHIVHEEHQDYLIAHVMGIGNIGVLVSSLPMSVSIPESNQLQLNSEALHYIRSSSHEDASKYYVRIEIVCKTPNQFKIRSNLFESIFL